MKKRITFTLDEETIEQLRSTSERTMIAQAKLVDLAIRELVDRMSKAAK